MAVAQYSFKKKWKIHDLDAYFWKIHDLDAYYLYKTTSKEFECLHESDMATMTFQERIFWLLSNLTHKRHR